MSRRSALIFSDSIYGSSPPSVFVGSSSYPRVSVGPLVPPIHGDTGLFDSPERWKGMTLHDIVNFRLNLVRGVQKVSVDTTDGRYIEGLQQIAMSSKPIDSDLVFEGSSPPLSGDAAFNRYSAPFGPVRQIKSARFSAATSVKAIEDAYYDTDLKASDAVLNLYNSGIEISRIQRCLSIGMLGTKRVLVPTRWSITATDDIVCRYLLDEILNYTVIDFFKVFHYTHYGNVYTVILFPHRWIYELVEATWRPDRTVQFSSDCEDARRISRYPSATAGAFFAAKLGVLEYLSEHKIQAGVLVLREILPEYATPVGVWQVRQGVRQAMSPEGHPVLSDDFSSAASVACSKTGIAKTQWLAHCKIFGLMRQKLLSDFF